MSNPVFRYALVAAFSIASASVSLRAGGASCAEVASAPPDSPPKAIKLYTPRYTRKAFKDKTEGKVQLTFDVDPNGRVIDAKAVSGPGDGLEETAVEAIMMSAFYPGYKDGKPVLMHARYTYELHPPKHAPSNDKPLSVEQIMAARAEREGRASNLADAAPDSNCPRVKYRIEPVLTEDAAAADFKGSVALNVVVDPEGIPVEMTVLKAAGMGLDEAAIASVLQWRFYAAVKDGKPARTRTTVTVHFKSS